MPLRVITRPDTGALTIEGTVAGYRVRRRAGSNDPKLAREEAAILEAELLRGAWHGRRPETRTLAQAVLSYIDHQPRSDADRRRLGRLLTALGDVALVDIGPETVDAARGALRPGASPATVLREIITPLRAVMMHAHRRKWCDMPAFDVPDQPPGRTRFLLPAEFDALHRAAAPHLQPLLTFLACVGSRMGETMAMTWREVDLTAATAVLHADTTKAGRRRVAQLPPAGVAALAGLTHRTGPVWRRPDGAPYAAREGTGGQIRTALAAACRRAGVAALGAHTLRHTWASWHYAVHRDLLLLRTEGGWASVAQVECYAHLVPVVAVPAILRVWGLPATMAPRPTAASRKTAEVRRISR